MVMSKLLQLLNPCNFKKLNKMTKNFVEELKWRGMLAQIMPGTEEFLNKQMTTAYLGTDPTADSLHIGHLCGIMMLRHLQRCGHKPIILVGGATGMIGDPSGKSQERNLLDAETLYHNQECIKRQVAKFLDFDAEGPNKAELVNNYDWMKDFTFLDFARKVGKHITVNYMMAKDSVQQRLNGSARDGLSFTEFTYQLLQGYDFLHLYQTMNCRLQLGGNDQWGNMTTGTELIRRTLGQEAEAFALTCPLITKSDRRDFLIEKVFAADEVNMVYSMYDRMVVGGAMPVKEELKLEAIDPLKAPFFTTRREVNP